MLVAGAIGFALVFQYVSVYGVEPSGNRNTGLLVIFAVPGVVALAGLLQIVSAVPFSELESRWMGLEGWQRGAYGTLVFFIALLVVGGVFVSVAYLGLI